MMHRSHTEEVGQALVWLICVCVCVCVCVGKLRNAIIFSARSSEVKVSNFKQLLLGSVKVREVFKVVQ